jgi:two-component system, OmpR family, alkaline phosphatase synthesis response regulator PhoP
MAAKILLIDDDIDLVEMNRLSLEAAGFEVTTAYDSARGVEVFAAFLPDVVIVDLVIEHADSGFILCRKLDQHPHGAKTKIVMLTSAAHETGFRFSIETSEERKWIKADFYLEKPVSPVDLVQFLKAKVLKQQEAAPAH